MIRALLVTLLFPIVVWAGASDLRPDQRREDFEQLVQWIRNDYGPLSFKRKVLGFDFVGVTQKYRDAVAQASSDDEFKFLLIKYVAEFRDAHFRLSYPTNKLVADLGFAAELVGNAVVVESVDRTILPVAKFPFERGDIILLWDKVPPVAAAREVSKYLNVSYDGTGLRAGVFSLTSRKASRFPLPAGPTTLSIQHRASSVIETVNVDWTISEPKPKVTSLLPMGLSDMCNEKSRIQPPPSAEVFVGVPFTAFRFDTPKGKIGFIRIPHYYPVNEKGEEFAKERFAQYQSVIEEYERTTNGLIIDQDFNCGGSVVFVNKMFSLFYGQPFEPSPFAFRASEGQLAGLRNQLNKFKPDDDGYPQFKFVIDEIERSMNLGLEMTTPLPMRGFMEIKIDLPGGNMIQPNPVRYSKPIVLLINEMSGSGGDLFPSLMKDFGRAKLFGTRTMGAGGHLWDDPQLELNHSRGKVNLTRSLIIRRNGQPIENYGVEPHESYQISMDDFMNGFAQYLMAAVDRL